MIVPLVLAAGLSRRMGQPKMVMPWRDTTIIGQVISSLIEVGLTEVWVVTGGAHQEVDTALQGMPIQFIFNPDYANGEMLGSIQVGLQSVPASTMAVLIVLGDQPQMEVNTLQKVLIAYETHQQNLVVPSYQMRRGHPWVLPRRFWAEVLALESPSTLRDFLQKHHDEIHYVNIDSPSILMDLDTLQDYIKNKPKPSS